MSEHIMPRESLAANDTPVSPVSPEAALAQFSIAILKLKDERDQHQVTFINHIRDHGAFNAIFPIGEDAARTDYIWMALRYVVDVHPTSFEDTVVIWDRAVSHLKEAHLTHSLPSCLKAKDIWVNQARSYMFRYIIPEIQDLLDTVLVPGVEEYYMRTPKRST